MRPGNLAIISLIESSSARGSRLAVALLSCLVGALSLSSCAGAPVEKIQPLQSLDELRLGIAESRLARSRGLLRFDEHGHFGEKVQYNSVPRGDGANFIVHCSAGRAFLVEVKYGDVGARRDVALRDMRRLVAAESRTMTEHDDEDLRARDAEHLSEHFYFDDGVVAAQLLYAPNCSDSVQELDVKLHKLVDTGENKAAMPDGKNVSRSASSRTRGDYRS